MSNRNHYFRMLRPGVELGDIETHLLKVNINCHGCKRRVKKLLRKIEGVFSVHIDEEHHVVKVTGKVDPTQLIKKLIKFGKHAEFWSPNRHFQFIGDNNNMDQMQHLRINGIDIPQTEHGSTAIGYDFEADSGKYAGYNIRRNLMTGKADWSFVDKPELRRMQEEGNTFAKNGYAISMYDPTGFGGNNGAGFIGLQPHESDATGYVGLRPHKFGMFHEVPSSLTTYDYNHPNLPSMTETSLQGYHHHNPSMHMNTYIRDMQSNNHMNTMFNYDNRIKHSIHIVKMSPTDSSEEENVYMSKLSEQADRYEEMVELMQKVSKTVEERNLLSVAYKNVIGARRASWRIISSMEQKEESRGNEDHVAALKEYRIMLLFHRFNVGCCLL